MLLTWVPAHRIQTFGEKTISSKIVNTQEQMASIYLLMSKDSYQNQQSSVLYELDFYYHTPT